MISWGDIYKVVEAMVPLYFALAMGYGSVRWWRIFTPEQCDAINRLVAFFTLPFFAFEFTLHTDPFAMNYRFIAADALSKVIIVLVLAAWVRFSSKGSYCWSITSFSLTTLTNSLVVGVPMLSAMYGPIAQDLVVQLSVVQALLWLTLLLLVLELRKSRAEMSAAGGLSGGDSHALSVADSMERASDGGKNVDSTVGRGLFTLLLMKRVTRKLAVNPNSYACFIGIAWAFVSNRWHFQMPMIMEGSVLIMSRAGTGMAMFSMGLFMALQERIVNCGASLAIFGMALRFIAGPAAMAISSIAVGLNGDVLRIAIIQAAVPQSITSFIFAREYGLHADILSTAVIFGMLVSLPVLVAYYVALELVH